MINEYGQASFCQQNVYQILCDIISLVMKLANMTDKIHVKRYFSKGYNFPDCVSVECNLKLLYVCCKHCHSCGHFLAQDCFPSSGAIATLPCKEYLNQDRRTVSHAVHRILQSQQNKLLWKHRHIIIHPALGILLYTLLQ